MTTKRFALGLALAILSSPCALNAQEILKAQKTEWNFLLYRTLINNAIDPANVDVDFHTTWYDPVALGYDGPVFNTGSGYFGYGVIAGSAIDTNIWNPDGALATNEPPSGQRYTAYFVTTVTPTQPVSFMSFTGIIDDGAFVYVNGVEVARLNVPDTAVEGWIELVPGGDEDNEISAVAAVNLPAGVPATIAVSMHSSSATSSDMGFDLLIRSEVATVPANDDFANAIDLTGPLPIVATGGNDDGVGSLGATSEPLEQPPVGDPDGRSIWWQWTPATGGRVSVSTNGSNFDTTLGVYTGSAVDALTVVSRYATLNIPATSADEPFHPGSRVEFDAEAGTTYYFAVYGTATEFGNVSLTIESNFTFLVPVAELLPARSEWMYLLAVDAANQPIDPESVDPDFDTTWQTAGLYDGPAFSGPATGLFGYGVINAENIVTNIWGGLDHDGDLVADAEPPTGLRNATYYRTTFTPTADVENLGFEALVDDGAIIYLDGVEVARMNLDAAKDGTDWAIRADGTNVNGTNDEDAPQVAFDLGRNLPANVPVEIAVSLHNPNATSSDAGFDLRVYAVNTPPDPPALPSFNALVTTTTTPGEYLVSWNSETGTIYRVEFSIDLITWFAITGDITADPSGVTTYLDLPFPEDTTGFYRIVVP